MRKREDRTLPESSSEATETRLVFGIKITYFQKCGNDTGTTRTSARFDPDNADAIFLSCWWSRRIVM